VVIQHLWLLRQYDRQDFVKNFTDKNVKVKLCLCVDFASVSVYHGGNCFVCEVKMTNKELLKKATEAAKMAYTPFTNFPVGVAVLTGSGKVFMGCNVETDSFGSSMCAERNAICAAVLAGEKDIVKIAFCTPKHTDCLPCGTCRQWIYNFTRGKDVELVTTDSTGVIIIRKLSDILPLPYSRLK